MNIEECKWIWYSTGDYDYNTSIYCDNKTEWNLLENVESPIEQFIIGYDANFDENKAFILHENTRYLFDLTTETLSILGNGNDLSEKINPSFAYVTLQNASIFLKKI